MGFFNRKIENKQQLETMRTELHTMRERLDQADAAKAELATKLGQLDAENQRLVFQVGSVASEVGSVRTDVATVASTIDRQRASTSDLPAPEGLTVAQLTERLEDLRAALATQQVQIADMAVVATDTAERMVTAEATLSADDSLELRKQLAQLAERVTRLDARLNEVSVELTNQFSELSSELEASDGQSTVARPEDIVQEIERVMAERIDPHLVDITDGQLRLANEQARYAIQFREDLAELAERLRRPSRPDSQR